eukprot:10136238-Ditylum_brightwellii.AAC.1
MAHAATPAEMELLIQTIIQEEELIPVEAGVKNAAGKYSGLMWLRTYAVEHPAAPLLAKYALDWCPVDCGEDWSRDHIEAAILHGPHKSACTMEAITALHDETEEAITNGFAKV